METRVCGEEVISDLKEECFCTVEVKPDWNFHVNY